MHKDQFNDSCNKGKVMKTQTTCRIENKMSIRRILFLLPLLAMFACSNGGIQTYPANDSHIQIMGRHLVDKDGSVKFAASGVTFYMKFRGTRLAVDLDDEFRDSTSYNWFDVIVDGKPVHEFRTKMGQTRYVLADSLQSGVHTLILCKATEGQNGHNKLVDVLTQQLLQAAHLPDRKIEYIGDSITCGFGDDTLQFACSKGQWFDHTNAWYAYGPRLSRLLHTQWMLSSVSGMGMYRNWNSPGPVMPDVYNGVYMEYTKKPVPWDFSKYTPDLVVIALGTNDFSKGNGKEPRPKLDGDAFVKAYTNFVATVRQKYPNTKFLLANSPMFGPDQKEILSGYLHRVIENREAAGDSAITYFSWGQTFNSGCDGHPDMKQQGEMAKLLAQKVRDYMNW